MGLDENLAELHLFQQAHFLFSFAPLNRHIHTQARPDNWFSDEKKKKNRRAWPPPVASSSCP
jgi:hypothetical protein